MEEKYNTIPSLEEPYLKYTLGWDYTFKNGVYWQTHYVHGFLNERGEELLHDYLIGVFKKKILDEELKLSLGFAGETIDIHNENQVNGSGLFPKITYYPTRNLEFSLTAFLIDSESGTLFGSLKNADQASLIVKQNF